MAYEYRDTELEAFPLSAKEERAAVMGIYHLAVEAFEARKAKK